MRNGPVGAVENHGIDHVRVGGKLLDVAFKQEIIVRQDPLGRDTGKKRGVGVALVPQYLSEIVRVLFEAVQRDVALIEKEGDAQRRHGNNDEDRQYRQEARLKAVPSGQPSASAHRSPPPSDF